MPGWNIADGFEVVAAAVPASPALIQGGRVLSWRDLDRRAGQVAAHLAGAGLSREVAARIRSLLRDELSPRHQPDLVRQVAAIPRTLTGKRMEVPVKRVLLDPGAAVPAEPGEPDTLADFRYLGRELAAARLGASAPQGSAPEESARRESAPRAT
jgi:hypothetical protein